MNSTMPDPQLKSMVLELRKEFEKSDNTGALTPKTHAAVRHADLPRGLLEVLAELDQAAVLGRATPEEAGASGVGKLDERTAVGKTFAGIAARLGFEGAVLHRASELGEPYSVLDADTPQIVVRAELLQLLAVAETGFLFASMLEQARPGMRVLSSLAPADRPRLLPALLQATGVQDATAPGPSPEVTALAERIRGAGIAADVLAAWGEKLRALPGTTGERVAHAVSETARRVGLVAGADLRFVARLLCRMDESLPKMQTVGKVEDIDDFIGGAPPVRTLLGFAATDAFGKALAGE
jgi:hypothetical protein